MVFFFKTASLSFCHSFFSYKVTLFREAVTIIYLSLLYGKTVQLHIIPFLVQILQNHSVLLTKNQTISENKYGTDKILRDL